jgi:hypothetical protein
MYLKHKMTGLLQQQIATRAQTSTTQARISRRRITSKNEMFLKSKGKERKKCWTIF